MNDEIKVLKELQELYLRKRALINEAQQKNAEYKHRLEVESKTERYIQTLEDKSREVEKKKGRLELEIKTLTDKVDDSEKRILQVKNATELQALQKQIDTLTNQKKEQEDELVKIYTLEEEVKAKLADVKNKYERYKKLTKKYAAAREDFMKTAEQELDEIDKRIVELRRQVSEKTLAYFDKIIEKANDVVVAKVENQRCSYCNQLIPLQDYLDLTAGRGLVRCAYCDRILYVDEKEVKKDS